MANTGFIKVDEADKGATQKVTGIIPVDVYLASFKDAQGKDAVRLVFQPKGTKEVYNLQEKIAGMNVATQASGWFRDSFNQKLATSQEIKTI